MPPYVKFVERMPFSPERVPGKLVVQISTTVTRHDVESIDPNTAKWHELQFDTGFSADGAMSPENLKLLFDHHAVSFREVGQRQIVKPEPARILDENSAFESFVIGGTTGGTIKDAIAYRCRYWIRSNVPSMLDFCFPLDTDIGVIIHPDFRDRRFLGLRLMAVNRLIFEFDYSHPKSPTFSLWIPVDSLRLHDPSLAIDPSLVVDRP